MNRAAEYAGLLLEKGREDLYVGEQMGHDPEAPEAVLGFHAQQAVEKFVRAGPDRGWALMVARQTQAWAEPLLTEEGPEKHDS